MSYLPTHARLVVIGGGIVGCSVLYHLVKLGWTDVVLIERDELTAGSTWHAAGNTPHYNTSLNLSRIHQESVALYQRLEAETGQSTGFHRTGSLRLASVADRMDEYRFHCAKSRTIGLPFDIVGPREIAALHPLLDTKGLIGAAWNPDDGHVDPSSVTQALAKGARDGGAKMVRKTRVAGLHRATDEWDVITDRGTLRAEIVVNAAGTWAREVGGLAGLDLPIVAMEHQYLVFDAMAEVAQLSSELPIVRDVDASYYLRQERHGMLLGPYERSGARPFGADGIPAEFGAELLPPDLDRLAPVIEAAMLRMPALHEAGLKRIVNGPITYTPDGNPLLGPAPGGRNLWLACGFSFGITQAGGAGRLLAEWIVEGSPGLDLFELDPRRYGGYATLRYAVARCTDIYQNEYAIAYPDEERPAGRGARTGPLYPLLRDKGGVFGMRNGWERPLWFAEDTEPRADRLSFRRSNWFEPVGREARRVREAAGLLDLSSFAKFEVSGADAAGFLDRIVANRLPRRDGGIALAHALTSRGGIASEFTVTRLAPDRFFLVSACAAELHDLDLLRDRRRPGERVVIENVTSRWGTLVLAGPRARDVLAPLTGSDLAFPWRTAREIPVGSVRVRALRLNFAGELGWELFHPIEAQLGLYERLMTAGTAFGLGDFGFRAMDSLRLEKGYRSWGADINTETTPLEAGLERFVAFDKGDFTGRDALLKQRDAGIGRRLVTLDVTAGDTDCRGTEPVFAGERIVGAVTSGGFGHTVGRSLALAYVETSAIAQPAAFEIEILGARRPAAIVPDCVFDPANLRPRT
ncbi:MAG TPA: FAD-dependent oxidoreductase [Acetobacteraceae bacterium]